MMKNKPYCQKVFYAFMLTFGSILLPYCSYALIEVTSLQHITGTCNGAINITASGTAGPFTFSWTGPNGFTASTEDISNLCTPGTYTVLIGFNNSDCIISLSATIFGCSYAITANPVIYPLCLLGTPNGEIDISPQGGYLPYTYNWSNGAHTQDLQNLTIGNYCVTITDALGCKSPQQCAYVDLATTLGVSATTSPPNVNPICGGPGTILISPMGGRLPYLYHWNTGESTSSISVTTSGVYTVTVTDACSNTSYMPVSYTIDPRINVTISSPPFVCLSSTGSPNFTSINAQVTGGTSPYTYNWSGPYIFTTTTPSTVKIIVDGTYAVTVTDSYGCTTTTSTVIGYRNPPNIALNSLVKNSSFGSCQPDGSISVTISSGLPPYQFSWIGPNGFTSANEDISNLSQGRYCLTVTDQNGCTDVECYNIDAIGDVYISSLQNVRTCYEEHSVCTGAISLGEIGIGPFSYLWSGPNGFISTSRDIENLCPGTYSVTISGPSSCTKTLTSLVCCCQYLYHGEPPSLPPTNSCFGLVSEPLSEITAQVIKPLGVGSTGSINISISGGLSARQFKWSGPGGFVSYSEDLYNLQPGIYCVTVTDGCQTKYKCITLKSCSEFLLSPSVALNCSGFSGSKSAGYINLNPTGGDEPYAYQWSNGSTTSSLTNLDMGTFSVTISDAGGCLLSQGFALSSRKEAIISTNLYSCERVFTCNNTSYSESGAYYREYINCDQFYIHCDLQPEKRVGGLNTSQISSVLDKENCLILCNGGEWAYQGEHVNNRLQECHLLGSNIEEPDAKCSCKYADGCEFENVTLGGKFYANYFAPTSGTTSFSYDVTKVRVAGNPCIPGKCHFEYSCNGHVFYIGNCFDCQAFVPPGDTIYELKGPSITLRNYLLSIFNETDIHNIGIFSEADLNMPIRNYFDIIDTLKMLPLKTINKDSLNNALPISAIDHYLIYPNPFMEFVNIQNNKLDDVTEVVVQICNTFGNVVEKKAFPVIDNKLDVVMETNELPTGLYNVYIFTKKSSSTSKLIKIKN